MKRLIIDGTPADLANLPLAINWEYLNLSDPGKKYSPYTSSLTLPFTAANKSIMGFADVPGGNAAKVRVLRNADLWMGAVNVIKKGTLKILSSSPEGYQGTITGRNETIEAVEAFTLDEIIAACAANFSYAAYADAIDSLITGTDPGINPGFILPRVLEDPLTSFEWTIYSVANGHTHELWLSAAAIITQLSGLVTLRVWEGDAQIDITASTMWVFLEKLYMPCWNWVLYDGATWIITEATGQRLINGSVVERSTFTNFGGKSTWAFLKSVAQLFCAAIYQDGPEITLIPLTNITPTGAIDLTGKAKVVSKHFAIPGHGSHNYISYNNTDNLTDSYGRMTIMSPVTPVEEKSLLTFDLMLPGRYYVIQYSAEFFNTNPVENGSIKNTPMLLYDGGLTAYTEVTHGTDVSDPTYLKRFSHYDFSGWWNTYQLLASTGIAYDAEVNINILDLIRLRPWKLVRINELGGLFYVNKISGLDPLSGKAAKCQIVKWTESEYFLTPQALVFAYYGHVLPITITSTVGWTVAAVTGINLDKTSGTGDDTVAVTCVDYAYLDVVFNFTFTGGIIPVTAKMPYMLFEGVNDIGTQSRGKGKPYTPQPSIILASTHGGLRRVFWAIFQGSTFIRSGYQDFILTSGTNTYFFSGLMVIEAVGVDYTFRVGSRDGVFTEASATYVVIA